MLRLRITTTREIEWVRGRRVPAGRILVEAPVAPEIDVATMRMALSQPDLLSFTVEEIPAAGATKAPATAPRSKKTRVHV